jgi:hypothetical protein
MRYVFGLCFLLGCSPAATVQPAPAAARTEKAACSSPEHRQFDFWVGTWDVRRPDGTLAGRNQIESILDGCGVYEQYASAKGPYTGRSLNIYDASRQRWHQTWIDNDGLLLQLDGALVDGKMSMRGTTFSGSSQLMHEIAWEKLPGDSVRQVWRTSADNGQSWKEIFVGIYSRAK